MAKISTYAEDATPTQDDNVVTVDDIGGTPATKRAALKNLFPAVSGYGLISVTGNTTAQTSISGSTIVDQFDTDGASTAAVTPDQSTGVLTLETAGKYLVGFQASFSGTASNEMLFQVYVGGVAVVSCVCRHTLDGSGNPASASAVGVVTATAGQDIDLRVTPTGTADCLVEDGQLWAVYMGP